MSKKYFSHQKAIVESLNIGENTRIWAFTHIMQDAIIGSDCNIGEFCFIENEVIIGNGVTIKNGVSIWDKVVVDDFVFVGPNAVFTNYLNPRSKLKPRYSDILETHIQEGVTIGANATILCGITLGKHSFIGAGSVVLKDVPEYAIMVGNPVSQIGHMCVCGKTIDFKAKCNCGRIYQFSNNICKMI